MVDVPGNFVITRRSPLRRRLILGAVIVLGALAVYIVYELGRFDGGYDRLAAAQKRVELEVQIEKLQKANRDLRTRLAELDTIRVGSTQERSELARTIGELQAQVARQTQDLAFYRGVMAQGGENAPAFKIQELHITATDKPEHFRVRLTLVQASRPDSSSRGSLVLTVEGESAGSASTLDYGALTGGKQQEQTFSFRYFESIEQEVVVPASFHPERLTVEVQSDRKTVPPLTQSFLWKLDPA